MSIPAVKAVSIGAGAEAARMRGSQVHDEIVPAAMGASAVPGRPTNRAGGLEGGVTNGQEVRIRASMKPIATLMAALRSIDLDTGEPAAAAIERSDTCAVPAASIVGEAMVALVLADALIERFGGDSVDDLRRRHADWQRHLEARFAKPGEVGPR
jgi:chorismate synthase